MISAKSQTFDADQQEKLTRSFKILPGGRCFLVPVAVLLQKNFSPGQGFSDYLKTFPGSLPGGWGCWPLELTDALEVFYWGRKVRKRLLFFFFRETLIQGMRTAMNTTSSFWCVISICVAHWVWPGVGPWTRDHRMVQGVGLIPPAACFSNYFFYFHLSVMLGQVDFSDIGMLCNRLDNCR